MARTVVSPQPRACGRELLTVLALRHVDEVDNNDTAHIAQAELPGDFVGGAEIDVEGIALLVSTRLGAVAGIDIDDMKRLPYAQ